jgi:hypothetical protein
MKIRGSLIVTKNLILPGPSGGDPSEGFVALSDSTGKVYWGNLAILPLNTGYTYPAKGSLVLSNNKIFYSIVDNAPGNATGDTAIWLEVGSGTQGSVLSADIIAALEAANVPTAGNPFATLADIKNLTIKGTATSAVIITKNAAIKNSLWISSTTGTDSYGTAVVIGDGLISDGSGWKTIGQIRGPIGETGVGEAGPQGETGKGIYLKGSAVVSMIVASNAAVIGNVWIATDAGVDEYGTPVKVGDGLMADGTKWINIGAIRGPAGISAYSGTYLIKGGVIWLYDYTYLVKADSYVINGILYSAAPKIFTLTPSAVAEDRIDKFLGDTNGTIVISEGNFGDPAIEPSVNESIHCYIGKVDIDRNTTQPTAAASTLIFDENTGIGGGEFDATIDTNNGATINLAYATASYTNATSIRIINGRNEIISFAAPAPIVFNTSFTGLTLRIKSLDASFKANVTVRLYKDGAKVGKALLIDNFGFNYSNVTDWQLVSMTINDFAPISADFNSVSIVIEDPTFSGKSDILIDDIRYQAGIYVVPSTEQLEYTSQLINNGDGSSPFITILDLPAALGVGLQEITDTNPITTVPITILDAGVSRTVLAADTLLIDNLGLPGNSSELKYNSLVFFQGANSIKIDTSVATGSRIQTLQDLDGVIALLSDITLDSATDRGNVTTNNITTQVLTSSGLRSSSNILVGLGDYDGTGNGTKLWIDDANATIGLAAGDGITSFLSGPGANISTGLLKLNNLDSRTMYEITGNASGFKNIFKVAVATQENTYTFPDKSGEVALKSDSDTYIFNQPTVETSWLVAHNTNKFPSVTVVDSARTTLDASVTYIDANNLIITVSPGSSGYAYLN